MAEQQAAPAASAPAASADPIARIQAMLTAESAPAAPAEQQQAPQNEAPEDEEAPAGPNTHAEGEDATQEQEEQQQAAPGEITPEQLEAIEIEVEVEGESGKVVEKPTVKELKLGYMRQKDYQKKTAEVARQRQEVGEQVRQGIQGAQTQYAKDLQLLEATLIHTVAPELEGVDWNKLASTDAFEYVRLKNRAEQIGQARAAIGNKLKELTDKHESEQRQANLNRAAKAREQLEQDIPGWNDSLYQTLIKSGSDYGFKPEEVATWLDPRSLKVLHDAYQFRQMKNPADKKLPAVPPKVLKPGAQAANPNQQRNLQAMKNLQKSGRIEDAASIIASRMR